MSTDGSLLDAVKLPATGGYLIDVNPTYGATGSITITAYSAGPPELVTPTAAGDERDIAVTGPGLVNGVRFNGTAGQRISARAANPSFSGAVRLFKPDGGQLGAQSLTPPHESFIDTVVLPSTGEYTVIVDPSGSQTGSSRVTVYEVPADQTGTLQPSAGGEAQTLSFATPGQNARLSFNGQAGQWVSYRATGVGAGSDGRILKADGTQVLPNHPLITEGARLDAVKLPATGGYVLEVNPKAGATGSITITGYASGPAEMIVPTVAGVQRDLNVTGPGLVNGVAFNGTAGQQISVRATNPTFSGVVRLLKPDGGQLGGQLLNPPHESYITPTSLPSAGVYTALLDPSDAQTGSAGLTVYNSSGASLPPAPSRSSCTRPCLLPMAMRRKRLGRWWRPRARRVSDGSWRARHGRRSTSPRWRPRGGPAACRRTDRAPSAPRAADLLVANAVCGAVRPRGRVQPRPDPDAPRRGSSRASARLRRPHGSRRDLTSVPAGAYVVGRHRGGCFRGCRRGGTDGARGPSAAPQRGAGPRRRGLPEGHG